MHHDDPRCSLSDFSLHHKVQCYLIMKQTETGREEKNFLGGLVFVFSVVLLAAPVMILQCSIMLCTYLHVLSAVSIQFAAEPEEAPQMGLSWACMMLFQKLMIKKSQKKVPVLMQQRVFGQKEDVFPALC